MDDLRQKITDLALSDALKHGSANSKSVLGKLLGTNPALRDKIPQIRELIEEIILEVNNLTIDKITQLAPKPIVKSKKKEEKSLPPLEENKAPVFRFAPGPSGPLHLGHTRAISLNAEYRDIYNGKLILRIEDTNPNAIDKDAYDLIPKEMEWLDAKPDEIFIQSDRMDIYYDDIKTLLASGHAYVSFTPAEEWRDLKRKSKSDNYRNLPSKVQLDAFDKLLIDGSGIVVIKTDLEDPNPALRDFVAFRVVEDKHPRQGLKYRLWPTYNFAVSIDDYRLGITHVLRGKDHLNNTERQKWIYKYMKWKEPYFIHYGLVSMPDTLLKTSEIKKRISEGIYEGWDDCQLATVQALSKRGFKSKAIRKFWINGGIKEVDITFSWSNLEAVNKSIIDSTSKRLFFVPNPIPFSFETPSEIEKSAPLHPDIPEWGVRSETISSESKIYLSKEDISSLKMGTVFRLKNLCNVTFHDDKLVYHGVDNIKGISILQWVSDKNISLSLHYSDGTKIDGLVEDQAISHIQETVQFERLGFATLNGSKANLNAFYLHK